MHVYLHSTPRHHSVKSSAPWTTEQCTRVQQAVIMTALSHRKIQNNSTGGAVRMVTRKRCI